MMDSMKDSPQQAVMSEAFLGERLKYVGKHRRIFPKHPLKKAGDCAMCSSSPASAVVSLETKIPS